MSRSQAIGRIGIATIVLWLGASYLHAAGPLDEPPANQHHLYYVVLKSGKKLSPAIKKIGILSGRETGWPSRQELANTPGYWAWIDEAGAGKLREVDSVETVEQFSGADIQVTGEQTDRGVQYLTVQLAPNSWPGKAARGSYKTPGELARQWTKEINDPKMRIIPVNLASLLVMSGGPMSELALSRIKECPQVIAMQWNRNRPGGGPSTKTPHEHGFTPPPAGRVTTRALGAAAGTR